MTDVLIALTRYNKLWTALASAAAVAVTTTLTTTPDTFGTTQLIQIVIAVLAALGVYVKDNTKSQPLGKFVVQLIGVSASFIVALQGGLTRPEIYAVIVAAMGAYLTYTVGNRPSEDIDHGEAEAAADAEVAPVVIAPVSPATTLQPVVETVPSSPVSRFDLPDQPITLESLDAAEKGQA